MDSDLTLLTTLLRDPCLTLEEARREAADARRSSSAAAPLPDRPAPRPPHAPRCVGRWDGAVAPRRPVAA